MNAVPQHEESGVEPRQPATTPDWTFEEIKARLSSIERMSTRSRYVILVAAVMSASFVLVEFNSYVSWHASLARTAIHRPAPQPSAPPPSTQSAVSAPAPSSTIKGDVERALLEKWTDSTTYSPSLLGVRVNVSDVPLLGSLALSLVAVWMFFSARRENHAVAGLLKLLVQTNAADKDRPATTHLFRYVYNGLTDAMLFTVSSDDDTPYPARELRFPWTHRRAAVSRLLSDSLALLPCVGLVATLALDVYSLGLEPLFSSGRTTYQVVYGNGLFGSPHAIRLSMTYLFVLAVCGYLALKGLQTASHWHGVGVMLKDLREAVTSGKPKSLKDPTLTHLRATAGTGPRVAE